MKTELHAAPIVDYRKVADAQAYYAERGYAEIAVPWIIPHAPYAVTRPSDRREFYTLGGYMNASGEQSFLALMLAGEKLGRRACVTSCFRDEPALDELHHRYFVKLELIDDADASPESLAHMVATCREFFDRFLPEEAKSKVIVTDETAGTLDIVDGLLGIELGSYGIRRHGNLAWVYGTGLALPRLDTVLRKIQNQKP